MKINTSFLVAVAVVSAACVGIFYTNSTYAADARNFNAGHIIDDSVFTNTSSMSVADIQNFLNSKVPTCDSWGQKTSELGGGTRAQWLLAHGISTPITCLRDYYENPSTAQNNYGSSIPSGAISAAQIIYNYSQQFGINPQVMLVTLQKENGLVTDEWPTPRQYTQAMGFGCPDNVAPGAPVCDPSYGSFSAQIYEAARHFRGFIDNKAGWFIPFTTGNNYIAWSPDPSCGGSTVNIENRATVALYSYTPYQPNQAAKNAQYGSGDSCSAHGNRNFYLYFTDWFGSTIADVAITTPLNVTSGPAVGLYTKIPTTVWFLMKNNRKNSVNVGSMTVSVRDSQGQNLDYELKPFTIQPYATARYESSQVLPKEDTYTFEISNYSNNSWHTDYPGSNVSTNTRRITAPVLEPPTLSSSLTIGNELREGKDTPITFTVKNNSSQSLSLGKLGVGVRGPSGENLDLPIADVTLAAGQSYTYNKLFHSPYMGNYRFFVINTLNNGVNWESNFPLPLDASIKNFVTDIVKPGLTITQSLQSSIVNPHSGQRPTISFKIRNYGSTALDIGNIGIMGRDPQGYNIDPGMSAITLAAGEERTVAFDSTMALAGTYRYSIISTGDNGRTWSNGPIEDSGLVVKQFSVDAKPGIVITQGLAISTNGIHIGQTSSIAFKVKNYGVNAVDLGQLGIMGRDPQGHNVDPGISSVTLAPNEERIVSFSVSPLITGTYRYGVIQTTNGVSWTSGPVAESTAVSKDNIVEVKPSITVTNGVDASVSSLTIGQPTVLSFKIKNFSSASILTGMFGLMGREAAGRNVDPGVITVSLAAGEEKTVSFTFTPMNIGTYSFSLLGTANNGISWNNGPELESNLQQRSVTVIVR